jgi:hypothetical protein
VWNFLLNQILKQGGRSLAGLAFTKQLNGPEAYADRIKRDFRLHDYADAWNLYNSDPAYWERYYNSPPNDLQWKDAFVRESAAQAGIPSRRNVIEYDYPGSAFGVPLTQDKPLGPASAHTNSFVDRFGNWTASPAGSMSASGTPSVSSAGPPNAVRVDDVRRLTRRTAPDVANGFAAGALPVPFLPSPEFEERFGNWSMSPNDRQSQ